MKSSAGRPTQGISNLPDVISNEFAVKILPSLPPPALSPSRKSGQHTPHPSNQFDLDPANSPSNPRTKPRDLRLTVRGPRTLAPRPRPVAVIQNVIQNRALADRRRSSNILNRLRVRSWMVPGWGVEPSQRAPLSASIQVPHFRNQLDILA